MRTIAWLLALGCGCLATVSGDQPAGPPLQQALTFHAPFDGTPDAMNAAGDPKLYHAATFKQRDEATPGLPASGEVTLERGAGRFGDALRFTRRKSPVVFFRGAANVRYKPADWNGTVSFWLRVDPAGELEPGFCDPVQITASAWNDGAFFVEFEKRLRPERGADAPSESERGWGPGSTGKRPESIPFRLGVYADLKVWNPQNRNFADIPSHEKPLVSVNDHPFRAGRWTHVVFTFEKFNTGRADGVARLYLDGLPQGSLSPRQQTFTWDPAKVAIALGLGYIGMLDELSLFDRALTADEIRTLHGIPGGVSSLIRTPGRP